MRLFNSTADGVTLLDTRSPEPPIRHPAGLNPSLLWARAPFTRRYRASFAFA